MKIGCAICWYLTERYRNVTYLKAVSNKWLSLMKNYSYLYWCWSSIGHKGIHILLILKPTRLVLSGLGLGASIWAVGKDV